MTQQQAVLLRERSRSHLTKRLGCRNLMFVRTRKFPNSVFLYEVYDDEAALVKHTNRYMHYGAFNQATGGNGS